jgi:hypothetical protein
VAQKTLTDPDSGRAAMHARGAAALERSRCGAPSPRGGAAGQSATRALGSFTPLLCRGRPRPADLPLTRRPVAEASLALHRAVVEGTSNRHLARAHQALRAKIQLLLAQLVNRYATAPSWRGGTASYWQ